jgi:tyrosine aminotransferase
MHLKHFIVLCCPNGLFQSCDIVIEKYCNHLCMHSYFPSFECSNVFMYQGAVPHILEKTGEDFFSKVIDILREAAYICYDRIKEIPCITCPNKPEGSMSVMVRASNI